MCMCTCIFTDANFNISTALLTSAGLFKILKGRWRHPQGDKTSIKIPLHFGCQLDVPGASRFPLHQNECFDPAICFSEVVHNVYK